jgi:hypothetical protein
MKLRLVLALVVLGACLGVMAGQIRGLLADPALLPPDDFVEYWAAGRLNLQGQNPYSAELLLPLEQSAGRDTDEAVMMWNPPWTLPLVMPLGAQPAREGQLVWLVIHFGLVLAGAHILWRRLGGPSHNVWLAWALALTFLPVFFALRAGQITPLVFFGVVVFAELKSRNLPFWAGAVGGVLMAVKPHLLLFVWIGIALHALATRRWNTILGGVFGGVVATAVALAFNPLVFQQYIHAYQTNPPVQWMSLTVGTLLRLAFGSHHFWFNFIPPALGMVWFFLRYWPHRQTFRVEDHLPTLVLASFLLAPYGAWHFDLVLLLVPILHRAATLAQAGSITQSRTALAFYFVALVGMLAVNVAGITSIWFAWVAPLVCVAYAITAPRLGIRVATPHTVSVPMGARV